MMLRNPIIGITAGILTLSRRLLHPHRARLEQKDSKMLLRVGLGIIIVATLPSLASAQGCRGMQPGPQKMACIQQKNPQMAGRIAARKEQCRNEARQTGLSRGKGGGMKGYVQSCMKRGQ